MKKIYGYFLIRLTIMTVLFGAVCYVLGAFLPENTINPVYPYILILFFLITAGIHFVLLRITRLNPRRFVSYFMLSTFIKLIVYFTAVLVYVFNFREEVLSFIITFFVLYIFYTVFEVVLILKQTKEL